MEWSERVECGWKGWNMPGTHWASAQSLPQPPHNYTFPIPPLCLGSVRYSHYPHHRVAQEGFIVYSLGWIRASSERSERCV